MSDVEKETLNALQTINGVVHAYNSTADCEKFIKDNANQFFVIVVSYAMGEQLISAVHDLKQTVRFFVYGKQPPRAVPDWIGRYINVSFTALNTKE